MNRLCRRSLVGLVVGLTCVLAQLLSATAASQQYPESSYQGMRWRMIGPFRGGRTRAVAGVPRQPNVFYICAVNGGGLEKKPHAPPPEPHLCPQPPPTHPPPPPPPPHPPIPSPTPTH